jgi:hypothetical protein
MLSLKISEKDDLILNSKPSEIKPGKKYSVKTKISALNGRMYSSYFAVFILDKLNQELSRKFCWIDDYTGNLKTYEIIFTAPPNSENIIIGYRSNAETLVRSKSQLNLQDLDSLKLENVPLEINDHFDEFPTSLNPEFKPLTEYEENILEEKMVWVLGSIRSGSTWLSRDLLEHNSNLYWHEPCIGWHLDAIPEWHYGHVDYFFSRYHKNFWLIPLKKLILARTYSHAQSLEKNIIIKEPNGSGAADLLMECFSKSKLIFLVRDGRDVVDSILDAHQPSSWNSNNPIIKLEPLLNNNMRLDAIKTHSEDWKYVTENVLKAYENHDPSRRLITRYENLRINTLYELKRIYDFLEINISNNDLQEIITKFNFDNIQTIEKGSGKFYRAATPENWKKVFTKNEIDLMNSIFGDTLKKVGYEV